MTGAQKISFSEAPGARTHFFGYPYTTRVLHCEGPHEQGPGRGVLRIPCLMGVGSSGGPYMVDLDAAGAGRVVAVNVMGDEEASYGTALGPFAERLYSESEQRR
ncbi:hypothetical protein [Streptomyces sp. NPDC002104]